MNETKLNTTYDPVSMEVRKDRDRKLLHTTIYRTYNPLQKNMGEVMVSMGYFKAPENGWVGRQDIFLLYDCFLALVLCLLVSGCWVYHIYDSTVGVFWDPRFKDQPLMVKVHGDRNRVVVSRHVLPVFSITFDPSTSCPGHPSRSALRNP